MINFRRLTTTRKSSIICRNSEWYSTNVLPRIPLDYFIADSEVMPGPRDAGHISPCLCRQVKENVGT